MFKKIAAVVFIACLVTTNVHAGKPTKRLLPAEGALKRINPNGLIDELKLQKVKGECFDELLTNVIKRRIPGGDVTLNESEIVMRAVLDERNVSQTFIYVNPAKNDYSIKRYVVKAVPGVSDIEQTYDIGAYTKFEIEYYQETLTHTPYTKVKCWIDQQVKTFDLGFKNVHLKLGDEYVPYNDIKMSGGFYRNDFNDEINVNFFMSMGFQNIFIYNQERALQSPTNNGVRELYYMKIPEDFWIDDDFENRFISVDPKSFRSNKIFVVMEDFEGKPYDATRPALTEFGFDQSPERNSFYF